MRTSTVALKEPSQSHWSSILIETFCCLGLRFVAFSFDIYNVVILGYLSCKGCIGYYFLWIWWLQLVYISKEPLNYCRLVADLALWVPNCNLFSCHISSFKGCYQYTSDTWYHPLKIELIYAESATNQYYLKKQLQYFPTNIFVSWVEPKVCILKCRYHFSLFVTSWIKEISYWNNRLCLALWAFHPVKTFA